MFARLKGRLRPAVLEGDIAGSIDAERMENIGVPVVQINTAGACHLDAGMVAAALKELDLSDVDLLAIENVGNLVCTAGYDLGEHLRIVVLGASEGDDKAIKYPAIFQGSDALVITKADLAPHVNFRAQRIAADLRRLRPDAAVFETFCRARRWRRRGCRLAGRENRRPGVRREFAAFHLRFGRRL